MGNFTLDSNISISDDHIGLDENQDYYDLENKNDTTQLNVTLDYCKVSREKYLLSKYYKYSYRSTSRSYESTTPTLPQFAPFTSSLELSVHSSGTAASKPSCSCTGSSLVPSWSISSVWRRKCCQV